MDFDHPLVEAHGRLSMKLDEACSEGNGSG